MRFPFPQTHSTQCPQTSVPFVRAWIRIRRGHRKHVFWTTNPPYMPNDTVHVTLFCTPVPSVKHFFKNVPRYYHHPKNVFWHAPLNNILYVYHRRDLLHLGSWDRFGMNEIYKHIKDKKQKQVYLCRHIVQLVVRVIISGDSIPISTDTQHQMTQNMPDS